MTKPGDTEKGVGPTKASGSGKPKRATPRRTTAPKPASQAAAIVAAAQTLADRQRVTAEILNAEESPSGNAAEEQTPVADQVAESPQRTASPRPTASPRTTKSSRRPQPGVEPIEPGAVPDIVESDLDATTFESALDALDANIVESDRDETVEANAVAVTVEAEPAVVESEAEPAVVGVDAEPGLVESDAGPGVEPEQRAADAAPWDVRQDTVLIVEGVSKSFGGTLAVDRVDLAVRAGSIFGIVGPNGAGKTTTLSMVTGLLRPDSGRVLVHGADVWKDPEKAKRNMGVLPDRLRLFDRLTGGQLLFYSGSLRGLDRATVKSRSRDLAVAFGLEDALSRLVTDYSAGMTKKIALAAAMIHSPRVLILDEPFEAVDPVSAANVIEILQKYASAGGTVVMSSHSMDLIQRICDSVTIIVRGEVLASGTMDQVRNGSTLEERFVELAGGRKAAEGMEWLHSFSG